MAKRSMTAPITFATGLSKDVDDTIREVFNVIDDNIDDLYAGGGGVLPRLATANTFTATQTITIAAPASVAGNGTAGTDALVATAQAGGASSGVTGQTGGAGGDIELTAGAGGDVPGAGGNGGAGGNIVLIPGDGGVGAATNGVIGQIVTQLAHVQAAANDAAAAALSVPVGGIYRTNADPSVLCIRTA